MNVNRFGIERGRGHDQCKQRSTGLRESGWLANIVRHGDRRGFVIDPGEVFSPKTYSTACPILSAFEMVPDRQKIIRLGLQDAPAQHPFRRRQAGWLPASAATSWHGR